MKEKPTRVRGGSDDLRPEYDFSGGVRGKYFKAYRKEPIVVVIENAAGLGRKTSAATRKTSRAKSRGKK